MRIDREELRELEAMGFDPADFERILAEHASGRWVRELVVDAGRLAPPRDEMLLELPPAGSPDRQRYEELGHEAIEGGRVGVIVLNGGMATRFGGVVKGTVEVMDGRSFLDLKLSQVRSVSPRVPVFLMNSPATHEATLEHLAGIPAASSDTYTFLQPVAPRVDPAGGFVREPDGRISTAGMGHGDVLQAFRRGGLSTFLGLGGGTLVVSNVDNLGATLDPVLVGAHLAVGLRASVEVARRRPEDKGGMPVLMDGRLQLLEGLRWPPGLDDAAYGTFNTNTFLIEAGVFEDPPALDAYPVKKEVAGRPAIQFERILGEMTHQVDTTFIVVPAEGDGSRFVPIKRREDLVGRRGQIAAIMRRWGVA